MTSLLFVDVHAHHAHSDKDTVQVMNLYPGDPIPAFKGKNFYSMGLHPWKMSTEEENNFSLEMMEEALKLDHVLFTGECGLDKVYGNDFYEQERVFLSQAMMAEDYQKPLLIHCVRAYNEISEMHRKICPTVPWIFHGYTGNPEMTLQLADKGFLFSFGKILFSPKAKAIESFRALPLQKIFLETDEFNGSVAAIYNKAAELREMNLDVLKEAVWENFNRLENVSATI